MQGLTKLKFFKQPTMAEGGFEYKLKWFEGRGWLMLRRDEAQRVCFRGKYNSDEPRFFKSIDIAANEYFANGVNEFDVQVR